MRFAAALRSPEPSVKLRARLSLLQSRLVASSAFLTLVLPADALRLMTLRVNAVSLRAFRHRLSIVFLMDAGS